MSLKWTNRIYEDSRVAGSARYLLTALADHANTSGLAYPSIQRLARRTNMSTRQVQRLIKKLVTAGELAVVWGGKGPSNTHQYVLLTGRSSAHLAAILDLVTEINAESRQQEALPKLLQHLELEPEKGDILPAISASSAAKGDIQGHKDDIQGHKGDIMVSPKPINDNLEGGREAPPSPGFTAPELDSTHSGGAPSADKLLEIPSEIADLFTQVEKRAPTPQEVARLVALADECAIFALPRGETGWMWVLAALLAAVGRAQDLLAYTITVARSYRETGPPKPKPRGRAAPPRKYGKKASAGEITATNFRKLMEKTYGKFDHP